MNREDYYGWGWAGGMGVVAPVTFSKWTSPSFPTRDEVAPTILTGTFNLKCGTYTVKTGFFNSTWGRTYQWSPNLTFTQAQAKAAAAYQAHMREVEASEPAPTPVPEPVPEEVPPTPEAEVEPEILPYPIPDFPTAPRREIPPPTDFAPVITDRFPTTVPTAPAYPTKVVTEVTEMVTPAAPPPRPPAIPPPEKPIEGRKLIIWGAIGLGLLMLMARRREPRRED